MHVTVKFYDHQKSIGRNQTISTKKNGDFNPNELMVTVLEQ